MLLLKGLVFVWVWVQGFCFKYLGWEPSVSEHKKFDSWYMIAAIIIRIIIIMYNSKIIYIDIAPFVPKHVTDYSLDSGWPVQVVYGGKSSSLQPLQNLV